MVYFFESKNVLDKSFEISLPKKFGYGTSLTSLLKHLLPNYGFNSWIFISLFGSQGIVAVSIVKLIESGKG